MATAAAADTVASVATDTAGLESGKGNYFSAANSLAAGNVASSAISGSMSLGAEAIRSNSAKAMQQQRIEVEQPQKYAQENTMQANQYKYDSQLSAQSYQQTLGEQNNQYNNLMKGYNTVMSNETNALSQAGLPSYLAYTPGALAVQPKTTQLGPGLTSYTSKIPGDPTTSAYTGTTTQNALGWGTFPGS